MNSEHAVIVRDLHKSFKNLKVLTGVSFEVKRGTILALLGPNGAGKTTTVRILSTLLSADSGTTIVNGHNVATEPDRVRENIGLTGQFAAVDEYLTGEENLHMVGRLYRLSKEQVEKRTHELLREFDLLDAAKRPVKTYSGGMKRKIDLAMSLIASPPVVFLDEPTTGLDPRSRIVMWDLIKKLSSNGTTILLTTQYMDEADRLADRIVVIDDGKVIVNDTPDALKARVGEDRIELTMASREDVAQAKNILSEHTMQVDEERYIISVIAKDGVSTLRKILKQLEDMHVENITLRRPTLDDVFLTFTGHAASENETK